MIGDLYKRYPWVCTVWAFMEVVLFAGVLFGWGSLVFILKEEGFYLEECEAVLSTGTSDPVLNMDLTYNSSLVEMAEMTSDAVNSTKGTYQIDINNTDEGPIKNFIDMGCQAQEAKLNLWFSIAVSIMYLSFTGIGYLIRIVGTRITRLIFFVIYLTGTMCLAFATPAIPWLIFPGLACIGTGGLTLLATNIQVADLHPHLRSTIVAIFTGFFDFSSINKQLIRIAFEGGIPRRSSYIFYALLYAVLVSVSTWFFLPKKNMDEDHIENIKENRESVRRKSHFQNGDIESFSPPTSNGLVHSEKDEVYQKEASAKLLTPEDLLNGNLKQKELENIGLSNTAINAEIRDVRLAKEKKPGLASSICNFTFLMHLFWLHVHALRFVTFIGLLNVWLEKIFQENEHRVGEMLSTFSYMTMGAIGTALFCGFVYDYLRTKYADCSHIRRVYLPVVLPMVLVIFYSMGTTVSCLIEHPIAPYFAFGFFTFFRSSLFTVAVAFVGDAYPMDHFAVMFGFIQCSAGVAGLIQYPIFQWYAASLGSSVHVNVFLLVIQAVTLIHPILLFYKGRRASEVNKEGVFRLELVVPSTA